jgi:Cys-tRNA(Pro)/Cys-tRNA(Cys) deacylase
VHLVAGDGQYGVMAATPALDRVIASGKPYRTYEYTHDPGAAYGQEAAVALGTEPDRVLKTLVVAVPGGMAVAVIPVSTELDLKAMARALGVKKAEMAGAVAAERATGYVVGGISPLGQKRHLSVVVDESASRWPTVFVSGGRRGLELELDPADLVFLTNASMAQIVRAPTHKKPY